MAPDPVVYRLKKCSLEKDFYPTALRAVGVLTHGVLMDRWWEKFVWPVSQKL